MSSSDPSVAEKRRGETVDESAVRATTEGAEVLTEGNAPAPSGSLKPERVQRQGAEAAGEADASASEPSR